MIRKIFHYFGMMICLLLLAILGDAFLGRPFTALLDSFSFTSISFEIFCYQTALSYAILLPTIILCWLFRGRLLPDSFLSCDLVAMVLAASADLWLTNFFFTNSSHYSITRTQLLAALCALFVAIQLSMLTTPQGRHRLIDYYRIFIFLLSAVFFLSLSIVLWPLFPRGAHFYYLCRKFWAPFAEKLIASPIVTEGLEKLDFSKPAIMVATHSSMLDIVALVKTVPTQMPMLSKKSIFYVPVFGQLAALAGYVFIDRQKGQLAMAQLDKAVANVIKRHQWLAIFAEGTRTPDGYIKPLKKGAFAMAIKARLPIVPVAIMGTGKVMPRHTWMVNPGTITVRFGQPIATTGLTLDDRQQLQEETQKALLELSGWQLLE